MKPIQLIMVVLIVLTTSACASHAPKQPSAAFGSGPPSNAEAGAITSAVVSSAPEISATEIPAAPDRVPDEMAGRADAADVQLPDARRADDENPTGQDKPADTGARFSAKLDDEAPPTQINDPWERYNRTMYTFNTKADKYVVRPVGVAYDKVVPNVVQKRVTSFFANLQEPRNMINQFLQGRPAGAAKTLGRFVVNTTAGVGGMFDPASKLQLEPANEDFGQTLAVWGWKDSRYFIVPLQGPRTVRDFLGSYGDSPMAPTSYINDGGATMALTIAQMGSARAAALPIDKLRAGALDEYLFVRDAWMQKRKQQIEERQ